MINIQNLSASFDNHNLVFEPLSMDLEVGMYYEVVGANGSGKTTFLKTLSGLKSPYLGSITWQKYSIINNPNNNILYIGHKLGLNPNLTPLENISFYLNLENVNFTSKNIFDALEKFEVKHVALSLCKNLSKGQQQKVALCKILLIDKPVWILDEPLSALDSNGVEIVTNLIKDKISKNGIVVAATHQKLKITNSKTSMITLN